MGKQAQIDDRMLVSHFPNNKGRQRHHGQGSAQQNEIGLKPVQVIAFVEHDLQRTHTNDQGDKPHIIHRLPGNHHRPRLQLLANHHHGKDADRDIDKEDPRPTVTVGDPAAQNGPGNRCNHRDHRQQCQCHPPFCRGVDRNQQGLGHGVQRPGH